MKNILEDRLKNSNVSIVLGCIKVFLNYVKDKESLQMDVYERVAGPLITLMSFGEVSSSFELPYIVLKHIEFIVNHNGASVFEKEFKQFYVRMGDPTYIKNLKVTILTQISVESTLGDILNELGEYVTDVDSDLSRKSIQALGGIAQKLKSMTSPILKQLTVFIAMQRDYIVNEVVIVLKDILRKNTKDSNEILSNVSQNKEFITSNEAKMSFIWLIGEYGEALEDSPYILEDFVDAWKEIEEELEVKQAVIHFLNKLLISCLKMFAKRAPEMHLTLGKLFNQILNNELEDWDLRDRAAFYYRCLQTDVERLVNVLKSKPQLSDQYLEDQPQLDANEQIEFNTLSTIFKKPIHQFIKSYDHFESLRRKENHEEEIQKKHSSTNEPNIEENQELLDNEIVQNTQVQNQPENDDNLLNLEYTPASNSLKKEDFIPNAEIDPNEFQSSWGTLNEGFSLINFRAIITRFLKKTEIAEEEMESLFNAFNLYCIASGPTEYEIKFYFYGQHVSDVYVLIELEVNFVTKSVCYSLKSKNNDLAAFAAKYLDDILTVGELI